MEDKLNNENAIRSDISELANKNFKDLVLPNTAKDEELTLDKLLKFLSGEESINGRWFGESYEGEPAFWWRPELKRLIKQYGLEQRLDELDARQFSSKDPISYYNDRYAELTALKQQLTPQEQEKL